VHYTCLHLFKVLRRLTNSRRGDTGSTSLTWNGTTPLTFIPRFLGLITPLAVQNEGSLEWGLTTNRIMFTHGSSFVQLDKMEYIVLPIADPLQWGHSTDYSAQQRISKPFLAMSHKSWRPEHTQGSINTDHCSQCLGWVDVKWELSQLGAGPCISTLCLPNATTASNPRLKVGVVWEWG